MPRLMIYSFLLLLAMTACNISGQKYHTLTVDEFEKKMNSGTVQLVDVRTPEEYAKGHLKDAINMNFNADDFVDMSSKLDKAKPILVYCQSGGRSAQAAALISKKGATDVYNLDGGLLAWNNAGKPLENTGGSDKGLNMDSYLAKIKAEELVIVDFNAVWCGPCKMLKPILDKIADKYQGKVTVMPIDVDQNPNLSHAMHIEGIPLVIMYKEGKEVWRTMGLTDQKTIEKEIRENK
jgi:thioredoxin 1